MHVFIHVSHSAMPQIKEEKKTRKQIESINRFQQPDKTRKKKKERNKVKTITNALPKPNQSSTEITD